MTTMKKLLPALAAVFLIVALSANSAVTYPVGRIVTPKGEILFYLYPQTAEHQASFIKLANAHYWDSLTFNRVIKNFVAQGGCPDTPAGFKDSPYNLAPEFYPNLRHKYGAVGCRTRRQPAEALRGLPVLHRGEQERAGAAGRQLHGVRPGHQGHGRGGDHRVGADRFARCAAGADPAHGDRGRDDGGTAHRRWGTHPAQ